MEVSNLILGILSTLIMSIPFSILIAKNINDKYSIGYFFITLITIFYFNNDMKNILLFIIYIAYSFIFIFIIKKNILSSFIWVLILNILVSLGDHISGFIFVNILKLSEKSILNDLMITIFFNISIILCISIFSILIRIIRKNNHKLKIQKG